MEMKPATAYKYLTVSYIINILNLLHVKVGHEGPEVESRYSSTLSLALALDGGGWSAPHPSCFTPGKDMVPIV